MPKDGPAVGHGEFALPVGEPASGDGGIGVHNGESALAAGKVAVDQVESAFSRNWFAFPGDGVAFASGGARVIAASPVE